MKLNCAGSEGMGGIQDGKEMWEKSVEEKGKDDTSESSVKAAFFKQIRFGEIGLSVQDCDDLYLSITERG